MSPRLLQLNVTANWGSTGKIAEGIGLAAMARGWESVIAYGRYMNPSQSQLIKVGNKLDVYSHYAKAKLFDGEGLGSRLATKALIRKIEILAPDVIHLHNIHDHWLNYHLLFEYLVSINTPIVWTFHDCWAFTGGCTYFDAPDCKQWKERCEDCALRGWGIDRSTRNFNLKKNLLSKFASKLVIVPVSHWLEELCYESFLKNIDIRLIHNGIDTNRFKPCADKTFKPLILGVALPWCERKGLDDMLKLRELLSSESIDMAMIGLSKKQLKKLPKAIIGIEKTQNAYELAQWYSRAWVYINPTHSDNFPTVNLEALACGTPVITYRTGGSTEAVDKETGIVIKKGDVKGLADAIRKVINNPSIYRSANCRQRAEKNFNQEIQYDKYIDLYEELLNR